MLRDHDLADQRGDAVVFNLVLDDLGGDAELIREIRDLLVIDSLVGDPLSKKFGRSEKFRGEGTVGLLAIGSRPGNERGRGSRKRFIEPAADREAARIAPLLRTEDEWVPVGCLGDEGINAPSGDSRIGQASEQSFLFRP